MADVRRDDSIAQVEIRTEDNQEIKSIELFAHSFRLQDETGEVAFVDEATRVRLLAEVEAGMLLAAAHEIRGETTQS